MFRTACLLAVLAAATTASAQVNNSLIWIGGGSNVAGIDYWDIASFDVDGTPGLAYTDNMYSQAPGNPVVTSVTMFADGHHLTTESNYWASPPYRPYNPGDPTHLAPAGEYDPHNFAPMAPDSTLVASEPGPDGSPWVASENGMVYRYNPAADENNTVIGQDVAVQFPTPPGSVLSDLEISDTHMYAFIEDASKNVTIYRQRTLSPEPMTTVASGKPYQGLTLLDDGALILAEVEYDTSLVRAGTLTRTSGTGPTWSVPLTKPILDLKAQGGFIWMLDANGDVYKVDPADGSGAALALFNSGIQNSLDFARGNHEGTELYDIPTDECPSDPLKFLPADCGCNYVEYETTDEIGDPAIACVHRTADVDINAWVGARAHIGKGSVLELFSAVEDDAFVGDNVILRQQSTVMAGAIVQSQSVIGDSSIIWPGAIISRDVSVGDCVYVWFDSVVGRSGSIGDGAVILPESVIGYNVDIPASSEIGDLSVLGNLVQFPNGGPAYIGVSGEYGSPTVIARGVSIGAEAHIYTGAVIGPETLIGDGAVVESDVRIRKNAQIGAGAYLEDSVRIGRSSTIGANAGVATPGKIGASAIVDPGVCVPGGTSVRSRGTATEPLCSVPFNETHPTDWREYYTEAVCGGAPPT